jgi:hypothetical protein
MRGTTRHICRDQHDRLLRGSRKDGERQGHLPGCHHGVWSYAVRVPTKQDPHGYLRRSGFASKSAADAELNRIVSLMDLDR